MTVAHTEHASSFDELEDHGKEFRSFRSKGSTSPFRGHSERDEKSPVSLNYGLNVRVSFFLFSAALRPAKVRPWESATRLFKLD